MIRLPSGNDGRKISTLEACSKMKQQRAAACAAALVFALASEVSLPKMTSKK